MMQHNAVDKNAHCVFIVYFMYTLYTASQDRGRASCHPITS